jgi:adenine deaminase
LITGQLLLRVLARDGLVVADIERDILKLTVVNRYHSAPPAVALVKNFGLRRGALAASVSHDSHNIVAVGTSDESLARAVNAIIEHRGGLAVASDAGIELLPLPIAGLMSDAPPDHVIAAQARLLYAAHHTLGCPHHDPFMPLSFMPLPVIPKLKLSDLGLVDVDAFRIVPIEAD